MNEQIRARPERMRAQLLLSCLVVTTACTHPGQQRVVVVAAHAPEAPPDPIAGARVRIECPEGVTTPSPSEVDTDLAGEAILSGGIPSACTISVTQSGYIPQSFRVADVCIEHPAEPFVCPAGVAFAPLVLEGRWNDGDASATAAALTNECFVEPAWAAGATPSIRVDRLINKTDEHIDVMAIANRILNAVVGSSLQVLDTARGAEPVRPADFYLVLEMTSVVTRQEGISDRTYSVTARIVRVENTEIVCQATAQRHKRTLQAKTTW